MRGLSGAHRVLGGKKFEYIDEQRAWDALVELQRALSMLSEDLQNLRVDLPEFFEKRFEDARVMGGMKTALGGVMGLLADVQRAGEGFDEWLSGTFIE